MNRIDLPHLVWILESLAEGNLVNRIEVDRETEAFARLALPGPGSRPRSPRGGFPLGVSGVEAEDRAVGGDHH
ncbi:hypothetical protein GCM10023084_77370 [Streptomyces lacrimifluminis]